MGKEKWLLRNPCSALSLKFQRFSLLCHLQTHQRQMHFLQVIWVLVLLCFALSVPLFQQLNKQKKKLLLIASVIAESEGSNKLIISN